LEAYLPFVLGHEFVAEVLESQRFSPGKRVVAVSIHGCGRCPLCLSGLPQLCRAARSDSLGMSRDGGLAELMTIPEKRLFPVPAGVPDEVAAICEPFATSFRAAWTAKDRLSGSRVLVMGPGVIGLMTALVAALEAPERLVVAGLERDKPRLELAKSMGLEVLVLPSDAVGDAVVEAFGGSPDIVYEATGSPRAAEAAFGALAPRGIMVVVGLHDRPIPLNSGTLVRGELTVVGSYAAGIEDWKLALALLEEGRVDLLPLVGPVYELADAEAAFRATEDGVVGRALVRCTR
jgi:threonine dehydrogenase-like Zn-dependent dehydrogenase